MNNEMRRVAIITNCADCSYVYSITDKNSPHYDTLVCTEEDGIHYKICPSDIIPKWCKRQTIMIIKKRED
jgi:hypothetical protein